MPITVLPSTLVFTFCFTIIILPKHTITLYCDKSFTYYEEYGQNSFNITCSGITKGYESILRNMTIDNEISLTLVNSTFIIDNQLFQNVANIKMLEIINCSLSADAKNRNTMSIFQQLTKLETIFIKNTNFPIVNNRTFAGVENSLKKLELINTNLTMLTKLGLEPLETLEELILMENQLENLDNIPLCNMRKLKILNLSSNRIGQLDMKCTTMYNGLPTVNNRYYNNLIELNLNDNRLTFLGDSLLSFKKLTCLNLGYNQLVNLKYVHFKQLFHLERVILNNNLIKTIDMRIFEEKRYLRHLDLSHNLLVDFYISNLPKLQQLSLNHNNLRKISLKKLPSLQELRLNHNNFTNFDSIQWQIVPNKLIKLNLNNNQLKLTRDMFKIFYQLELLSINNNNLTAIPRGTFSNLNNLIKLDLSQNQLIELNRDAFTDLNNLEILNLSSNSIGNLSYLIVENLNNLRLLDLSANKLKFIEYDRILAMLPLLSNINIKYNYLTCDNLTKLITFLRNKHIGYTHNTMANANENIHENIAGIPCRSSSVIVVKHDNNNIQGALAQTNFDSPILINLFIIVFSILILVLSIFFSFKFYIYLKRRLYRAEEFELVNDN